MLLKRRVKVIIKLEFNPTKTTMLKQKKLLKGGVSKTSSPISDFFKVLKH